MATGVEVEGAGFAEELHVRFMRELVAFAAVAGVATGDKIFPRRRTSSRTRDYVVEREFPGREHFATVLAGITVTHQDVFARESARLVRNAAIFEQTDDGWHSQGDASSVEEVSIFFFRHGHAFEHEDNGAARGTHVNRLVRGVQNENRRMERVTIAVLVDTSGQERDRRVVANRV